MQYTLVLATVVCAALLVYCVYTTQQHDYESAYKCQHEEPLPQDSPVIERSTEEEQLDTLLQQFSDAPLEDIAAYMVLLEMGDVYARGVYGMFKPDRATAEQLYRVAATCPHKAIASLAVSKCVEARLKPVLRVDVKGNCCMPTEYATMLCRMAKQRIEATPASVYVPLTLTPPPPQLIQPAPPQLLPQPAPPLPMQPPLVRLQPVQQPPLPALQQYNAGLGSQNVHDSAVVSALAKTAHTLQELPAAEPADTEVIMACIQTCDMSEDAKGNAQRVIRKLGNSKHARIGLSEQEALDLTWSRIQAIENPDVRSNAVETLGKQLASGVEHDMVVCSTGRIARVLGALEGIDDTAERVRPTASVLTELQTLAAKVRNDHLATLDAEQVQAYNSGAPESADTSTALKKQFRDAAHAVYVKELGMTPAIVEPLMEPCLEEL